MENLKRAIAQKRYYEVTVGYFLILVGLVFICSIPLYYLTETEPFENRSAVTTATITDLERNDSIFGESYYASYQYIYDEDTLATHTRSNVRVESKIFQQWEIGNVIEIRYLIHEPKTSQIVNGEYEAPLWQFLLVITILLFIGTVLIRLRYNERKQLTNA